MRYARIKAKKKKFSVNEHIYWYYNICHVKSFLYKTRKNIISNVTVNQLEYI